MDMRCINCGSDAHCEHNDLCCTCFEIAFGRADHRVEHSEANRAGSDTYVRNAERAERALYTTLAPTT